MKIVTAQQYVELFHLLFLDQLSRKLDKRLYALKGGCNLRFFFKSIRYSEDIDIDVQTVAKEILRKKIQQIMSSSPFNSILSVRNIEIDNLSEPKQTDTTQRWKLTLKTPHSIMPLHTKIGFSRHEFRADIKFEAIDTKLTKDYQLTPILANHYTIIAAYEQKINAVLSRTQPQTRDVFDIYTLLKLGVDTKPMKKKVGQKSQQVKDHILAMTFQDFEGQVLAYLPPDYQAQHDSQTIWDDLVLTVIETLDK